MGTEEMLEVVNEVDEVVGLETRATIHQQGLRHREVHVWFFTPQGEIVFQHRAKDKDTYPDRLDATVGGHVEPGMSYEQTAEKECKEETGVAIDPAALVLLKKMFKRTVDADTGLINNTVRMQYAYLYPGKIEDLVIEAGKALGFETWSVSRLRTLTPEEKERFIPVFLSDEFLDMFDAAKKNFSL